MLPEVKKVLDEYYSETRAAANNNVVRNSKALDNVIFAVTTGAIVLAVGSLEKIAPQTTAEKIFLGASISLLFFALILHAIDYLIVIAHNSKIVASLDAWKEKKYSGDVNLPARKCILGGLPLIEWITILMMILGILSLLIYALCKIL